MTNFINGYTSLYGIVAQPIKHSLSPMMHNTAFQELGMNSVYLAFETAQEDLEAFINSVKTLNILGFNVSMPYKQTIMKYLDELSEDATLCEAVNTVKYVDGKLIGHITDGKGFFLSCEQKGWRIQGKKVVILGAGGAANAIIVEAAMQQASEIIVYNRSDKPFVRELNNKVQSTIILKDIKDLESLKEDLNDAYMLIQTSSVGMNPHSDGCLIPDCTYLHKDLKVVDIIYQPKETVLLKYAREQGCDYMNGEGMILYQGAVAFEYWTGEKMPIECVKKAIGLED